MEHRGNEARVRIEDGCRKQDPGCLGVALEDSRPGKDERSMKVQASRPLRAQGPNAKWDVASWVNWQSALYLFALGWICVFLAPLTSFWWLVLVVGPVVPMTLATPGKPGLTPYETDDSKGKEQELLEALPLGTS